MHIRLPGSLTALLLIATLLTACSSGQLPEGEDYLARLSRVLEQPLANNQFTTEAATATPDMSADLFNAIEIRHSRISLLQLLSLNPCQLSQRLNYKNSQLGKLARPSQQLHIEADLLRLLPECIEKIKTEDKELALKLSEALALKQQQRMALWWNAWFHGEEWRAFVGASLQSFSVNKKDTAAQDTSLQALAWAVNQGNDFNNEKYRYGGSAMELQLQQLLLSEGLGRWRLTTRLLTQALTQAKTLLNQRLARKAVCFQGKANTRAERLQNVFHHSYIQTLQPLLSQTHRYGQQLTLSLRQLQPLVPEPKTILFNQWLEQLEQQQSELTQASRAHVEAWKPLLEQCGLLPG